MCRWRTKELPLEILLHGIIVAHKDVSAQGGVARQDLRGGQRFEALVGVDRDLERGVAIEHPRHAGQGALLGLETGTNEIQTNKTRVTHSSSSSTLTLTRLELLRTSSTPFKASSISII